MTRVAIGNLLRLLDFVFLHQPPAQSQLVGRFHIVSFENIFAAAHVALRVIMAIDAPAHVERIGAVGQRHLANRPVAGGAAYSFIHMNAVVEVDEIRHGVDARPFQRLVRGVTGAHGLQHGTVQPQFGVATHADLRGGNARVGRLLHRGVAVAAIDAVVGNVMLVAEGNRLLPRHIDVGIVGGLVDGKNEIPQPSHDEDRAIDRHLGDRVRAAMEDLRHRTILPDASEEDFPPAAVVTPVPLAAGSLLPRKGDIGCFQALLDSPRAVESNPGSCHNLQPITSHSRVAVVHRAMHAKAPVKKHWGMEEIRAGGSASQRNYCFPKQ